MRAIAERIGKSKKERVIVDGEVFLKSVDIGKWSHVGKVTYDGNDNGFILKSSTEEGINKAISGFIVNVLTSETAKIERL